MGIRQVANNTALRKWRDLEQSWRGQDMPLFGLERIGEHIDNDQLTLIAAEVLSDHVAQRRDRTLGLGSASSDKKLKKELAQSIHFGRSRRGG